VTSKALNILFVVAQKKDVPQANLKAEVTELALHFRELEDRRKNRIDTRSTCASDVHEEVEQIKRFPSDEDLYAAYAQAALDAKYPEPDEVSTQLMSITPANPCLIWSPTRDRVLVDAWLSWDGYKGTVGRDMQLPQEVWVTAAPELQKRCRALPSTIDPVLRLEQLLGLPPHDGKTWFVQLWVEPRDMFRPAPDPEVSDSQAELDFPTSTRAAVSRHHVEWFNDLKAYSYDDKETFYPWTRLGYTYD
jgi:hypothetical protein